MKYGAGRKQRNKRLKVEYICICTRVHTCAHTHSHMYLCPEQYFGLMVPRVQTGPFLQYYTIHFISSRNTQLSDSSFLYNDALYSNALDYSGEIKTKHRINFAVFFRSALTMAGQIVLLGRGMTLLNFLCIHTFV